MTCRKSKIGIFILFLLFFQLVIKAQTLNNYSVQVNYIYGNILKHTVHLQNLVKGPDTGAEINIEWPTNGQEAWQQYFRYPTVGIGITGLDLGNTEMLGQLLAVYPYLKFNIIDTKSIILSLRGGAGMSFLNKRFDNTATNPEDLNTGNAAIGSIINVYFAGGGDLEIPITHGFSAIGGFHWNHASNGSFYQPNSGINMLNARVGIKYNPNYKNANNILKNSYPNLPQKYSVEFTLSGGARELYYRDNKQYPVGSAVVAIYRQLGNLMHLGLGMDAFYDGVYNGNTLFKRTYLTTDEFKNKIRVGVSLQPELVFGKLTAGIHLGMYLYNPLKNLEPYADAENGTLHKGLIYKYNIEEEDGWFYSRASLKYALNQHIFASLGLKTHLQKAEFIEWGLGYKF